MATDGIFKPTNPWPDPEPDSEEQGRFWRSWVLGIEGDADAAAAEAAVADRDVRISSSTPGELVVQIRSDDPTSCDIHEVMKFTRGVFALLDTRWPIRTIQRIPKESWLFLK